jgi:DNA-binding beta-propeller fold protein YncE
MALKNLGTIDLPAHIKPGGFDHAAIHIGSQRMYVAHTANDAVDVIDCINDRYLRSVPNLVGVAGVLVSDERNLIFTSNRGESTVGIFSPDDEAGLVKVEVRGRPNGLAYDPGRNILLAADGGNPAVPGSVTLSIVDVARRTMVASIPVPGRTRWALFDQHAGTFYVNITEPPQIVVIATSDPSRVAHTWQIPASGPHGLDLDIERRHLFCACDGKKLIMLDADSGKGLREADLSGVPDVAFYNPALNHLYIAIGDPGVIDVFDTRSLKRMETVSTEPGAHTIGFDSNRNRIYAFLPNTHRTGVYVDEA